MAVRTEISTGCIAVDTTGMAPNVANAFTSLVNYLTQGGVVNNIINNPPATPATPGASVIPISIVPDNPWIEIPKPKGGVYRVGHAVNKDDIGGNRLTTAVGPSVGEGFLHNLWLDDMLHPKKGVLQKIVGDAVWIKQTWNGNAGYKIEHIALGDWQNNLGDTDGSGTRVVTKVGVDGRKHAVDTKASTIQGDDHIPITGGLFEGPWIGVGGAVGWITISHLTPTVFGEDVTTPDGGGSCRVMQSLKRDTKCHVGDGTGATIQGDDLSVGGWIHVAGAAGTITLSHLGANAGTAYTGTTGQFLNSITYDAKGHVSATGWDTPSGGITYTAGNAWINIDAVNHTISHATQGNWSDDNPYHVGAGAQSASYAYIIQHDAQNHMTIPLSTGWQRFIDVITGDGDRITATDVQAAPPLIPSVKIGHAGYGASGDYGFTVALYGGGSLALTFDKYGHLKSPTS